MLATKINNSRIAGPNDLYSVTWIQFQLVGSQKISRGTRGYLWFLLALVKLGFETIAATQREIADSYYRASGGNKSLRSLQYAMKELEENGFIRRSRYRIGPDHFRSVIVINKEAFSFWTRKKTQGVVPITTQSHISLYAQNMRKDTVMEITPCKHSYSYSSENKEPRAHTRSKTHASNFKFHPIIFSLLTVLKWPKYEPPEIKLAKAEISGLADRTEIRWPKWEREWQRLPIDEREGICRTSFLPRLKDHASDGWTPQKTKPSLSVVPSPARRTEPKPVEEPYMPATREYISGLLAGAAFYKRPVDGQDDPASGISPTDMELLCECRKVAQNRRQGIVEEHAGIPDISSHNHD